MRVVLDTNIILASVSPFSPFRMVLDKWEQKAYDLCLTTDILLEYEEKLGEVFDNEVAQNTIEAFTNAINSDFVNIHFRWNLIYPDLDDNKFVDCAIAAGADYLVTNDRDYLPLKKLGFPKIAILKIEEFMQVLKVL